MRKTIQSSTLNLTTTVNSLAAVQKDTDFLALVVCNANTYVLHQNQIRLDQSSDVTRFTGRLNYGGARILPETYSVL